MPLPDYPALIEMYRRSLPEGESVDFRIDPLDHLGIPIVNVDLFMKQGGAANGIGYGATEEAARLGAYGELCEEYHLEYSFKAAEQITGSYQDLVKQHGREHVIDPLTLVLPAGANYTASTALVWVEVTSLVDEHKAWCPAEFVATGDSQIDYPNKMTTCIRNGSGAGDTLERALLHGALELLQRDGNADCFRALDRGLVIDPQSLPGELQQLLQDLRRKDLAVTPKLARTTCGSVSVYAVGDDLSSDAFPLAATACGEGADPDATVALRKAILECASSHSRKRYNNLPFDQKRAILPEGIEERLRAVDLAQEEQRALRAMYEWTKLDAATLRQQLDTNVFKHTETINFASLPRFGPQSVADRWAHVKQGLLDEGLHPYVFRCTTTGGHGEVAKVIVPGIEMELASYHRIGYRGVRRLLERTDIDLIGRQPEPGARRVLLTKELEDQVGGPAYLRTDRLDEIVAPFYALYREPSAHAAVLADERGYFSATPS